MSISQQRILTPTERAEFIALRSVGISEKDIRKHFKLGAKAYKRIISELDGIIGPKPPRNSPPDDLVGQKFNFLTISGFIFDAKYKVWKMEVVCDCGNQSSVKLYLLKNGQRKTCGIKGCPHFHEVRKTNGRSGNFTGCEEIYGSRWGGWRCGAVARDLEFLVTPQFGWDLFLKQDRKCALSGVDLTFGNSWNLPCTASLDRIDSSVGYTELNVQWVHKQINLMKRDISDEDFIDWCSLVL